MPDSIKYIRDEAFFNCKKLNTISLSKEIQYLGKNVFYGCENLSNIKLNGLKQEWSNIDKATEWNKNINNCKIECIDGSIDI